MADQILPKIPDIEERFRNAHAVLDAISALMWGGADGMSPEETRQAGRAMQRAAREIDESFADLLDEVGRIPAS